ncbi:hypothetical protein LINBF2_13100 [Limnohabitans sp. INBF002]|nr:hypothetical protein LINBF2_13100 [Limnohabitans sp. INBF002]
MLVPIKLILPPVALVVKAPEPLMLPSRVLLMVDIPSVPEALNVTTTIPAIGPAVMTLAVPPVVSTLLPA